MSIRVCIRACIGVVLCCDSTKDTARVHILSGCFPLLVDLGFSTLSCRHVLSTYSASLEPKAPTQRCEADRWCSNCLATRRPCVTRPALVSGVSEDRVFVCPWECAWPQDFCDSPVLFSHPESMESRDRESKPIDVYAVLCFLR